MRKAKNIRYKSMRYQNINNQQTPQNINNQE